MATVHVRDVPDETLATLKARAARAGQSVQAYLRNLLDEEVARMTPAEAADRAREIARHSSVTTGDVLAAIEEGREAGH